MSFLSQRHFPPTLAAETVSWLEGLPAGAAERAYQGRNVVLLRISQQ